MINWISALDMRVLEQLYAARTASGVSVMANVSASSEWTIVLPVASAAACLLYFAARRAEALGLIVAVFGSGLTVLILKYIVARPRPPVYFWAVNESGPSFPSAHAALAIASWGFLAYLICRNTHNKLLHWFVILLAVAIALLVGFSRLYLGVHYLSDVVGGSVVGALFLCLGIIFVRRRAA